MIPVVDVGTGVGRYLSSLIASSYRRLGGRGRPGEDEKGSNAGSN